MLASGYGRFQGKDSRKPGFGIPGCGESGKGGVRWVGVGCCGSPIIVAKGSV